jgi:hypothetical protein
MRGRAYTVSKDANRAGLNTHSKIYTHYRCPCHSERSEESPRGPRLLERFFASLRMTNVTRSIIQCAPLFNVLLAMTGNKDE